MTKIENILIDSSVWLELFFAGPRLSKCEEFIKKSARIFVPTIVVFEVYKKLTVQTSEDEALSSISFMMQKNVCELTSDVALTAADISIQHKIGMADSIVLAHARKMNATLVTLDNDFSKIPEVIVLR